MSLLRTKLVTAFDLGLFDILNVLVYRLGIVIGLSSIKKLNSEVPQGPFFKLPKPAAIHSAPRKGFFYNQEAFGVVSDSGCFRTPSSPLRATAKPIQDLSDGWVTGVF